MSTVRLLICAMTILLTTAGARGEECPPQDADAPDGRARRDAAMEYIVAVNTAQTRLQKHGGKYAPLNELSGVPSAPVGFIPKLLVERWSYMVSLKDYFDACGFAAFSDERGVIYEAHPLTIARSESGEIGDDDTGSR